ncbi:hypothetical protein ACFIOY_20915 [Bradyrhizobium sp. TZ2]
MPMLSSDHNGERVGAVAAIERVLESNNCGWHDLAASIGSPAPAREPHRRRQAPDDDTSTRMDADELIDLITTVRDSGARIGPSSEQFLDGLLERAGVYSSVFISAKQQRWLDDLVRKARKAAQ